MKKVTSNISEKTRRRKEKKELERLTRTYPSAVAEARGLRKDPIAVPEEKLRELEEMRMRSYHHAFRGGH